jgi:hypothetical protein
MSTTTKRRQQRPVSPALAAEIAAAEPALRAIAQRQANARQGFIETCVERGFTEAEGAAILNCYIRLKVVKLDSVIGRYSVIHGAYWDDDVLRRALSPGESK